MATDDFFLKFGSDANQFSRDLVTDLGRGVEQINTLTDALIRYDETVARVKNSNNPLGNLFANLDQAGARLEKVGNTLAGQFDKIISSVGQLSADLQQALDSVVAARVQVRRAPQPNVRSSERLNANGFTAEQQRIIDAQRRASSQVTDADLQAAGAARGKNPSAVIQARTMEQLNRDAVEARNSLRTVANASSTVARNSRDASSALKDLGQSIRTLTTQTKTTTHGVTEGRFQHNTVVLQGAGGMPTATGIGQGANLDQLLGHLGIVAAQGPIRDQGHAAQRDLVNEREARRAAEQALHDLSQPARPGFYRLGGQPGKENERYVDERINPGESFEQYFTRRNSTSADLDRIRRQVREGSESRLGVQQATQLGVVQNLIGRRGLEQLLGHPALRQEVPGVPNQERIRASIGAEFAPSKALTPAQYELVPAALRDFAQRTEEFRALSEQYVRTQLQGNPLETFALGGRGDGGDVFGRNKDFRGIVADYDRTRDTEGADYRAGVEERQAARGTNRNVLGSAYASLSAGDAARLRQQQLAEEQRQRNSFIDPRESAQQDQLAAEALAEARRQNETGADLDARLKDATAALNQLTEVVNAEASREAGAARAAGGGGGRKPPRRPPGSKPEPAPDDGADEGEGAPARAGRARSRPAPARTGQPTVSPALSQTLASLQDSTRAVLEEAKRALPTATGQQRRELLARAGAAFQDDPLYAGLGSRAVQKSTFRDLLGLAPRGSYAEVHRALGLGGDAEQLRGVASSRANPAGGTADQNARLDQILATESVRLREALLAEFVAQERLNKLRASGTASAIELANAERALSASQRISAQTARAARPPTLQQKLFGQQGFAQNQLRHIGLGVENIIGYSLVFTGFEKLRELAHTGLEAQAAFVRLQATLDANGVEAGNLQTRLQGIASNTATPLENVIEAAAELAGVFTNTADLQFGTKIAAQLSNISQGTLTTKEAAIGLRDVIDAYGVTGRASIQAVGDEIARLSQLTGVSVKDITEGTTQIAQEAREFGLSQHQASTLAAYVSRGTGESGEQSASQASRFLASLYTGQAQRQLVSSGIATSQQFQSGDIAGVLTNLISKYKDLAPAQRQAIASLVGTGIQARAFASIVNIGAQGLAEFNNQQSETGTLARQNQRVLQTIAGEIKQVDEDFQSLGSNLQRLGAFDFIGALAKSLDLLLKLINATFGRIADLADKSPATQFLLHLATFALEAAAAFKVLGGVGISALNRAFPNVRAFQPVNAAAVAERNTAIAGGAALEPLAPVYRQPTLRGAAQGAVRGLGGGFVGLAGRGAAVQEEAQLRATAEAQARLTSEAGLRRNAAGMLVNAQGRFVSRAAQDAISRQAASEGALAPNRLTRFGRGLQTEDAGRFATGLGTAAERSGQALTGLRSGLESAAQSTRGAVAGIGVFNLALLGVVAGVTIVTAALEDASRRAKAAASIREQIVGPPAPPPDPNQSAAVTATQSALQTTRHTGVLQAFAGTERGGPSVFNTSGPNAASEAAYFQLVRKEQTALRAAYATGDAAKIAQAQQAIDNDIKTNADAVAKAGGNNKENQAEIYASIVQLQDGIRQSADNRIKALQGLQQIDVLTQQQAIALTTLIQTSQGLTNASIASNPQAIRTLFDQSGLSTSSKAGRQSLQALGISIDADGNAHATGATLRQRMQGQLGALDTDIAQQSTDLTNPGQIARLGGLQGDAYKALQQSLQGNIQLRAQIAQQLLQNPAQAGQGAATALEQVGDYSGAVQQMQVANQALTQQLNTLDVTDPQYWATLKQIQDNKNTIAQLLSDNVNNSLNILASATADPVAKAALALQVAQNVLRNVPVVRQADLTTRDPDPGSVSDAATRGHLARQAANSSSTVLNTPARTQALEQANQQALALSQAREALREAQASAASAGIRNAGLKAQADLNEVLRQEGAYSRGALRDDTKLAQLRASEQQDRIALRDAIQADAQAVYDATAALQKLRGNDVGAAQTELSKAHNAYAYAVAQYGRTSEQARAALAAVYQAQDDVASASLALITSRLDLQIAQLNARGKAGDAQRAAQDEVRKAQAALSSYRRKGGQSGTAEYNKLLGDVATAQRNAFDVALNAQLDTLDFQRETYQITSAQEIASLQLILKNKQLTLAEQRSITLKIKDLQTSIREQLTQGGLNIPSDIKLPTAYEVRRSLGAGFAGSATHVITNNNQRVQVQITQTLPTAALAKAVADQVVDVINRQTGQQVRSNSATPRLVSTR